MNKPISKYDYYAWTVRDYDDWAEQVNNHGDCMLKREYAERLEKIYENKEYTDEQHKENISFLNDLQCELNFVWNYSICEKSGMGTLVQDYKDYFCIK